METPPWVVMNDVTNNQTIDLSYRLAKLPAEANHNAKSYLVIPRLGVVTPIQTPTADYDPDNYTAIKSGLMPKGIHKRYLKDGILRMPDGPNG